MVTVRRVTTAGADARRLRHHIARLVLTLLAGPQLAAVLLGGAGNGESGGRSGADRLVGAVRVYQQRVSARRPPVCRFTPSCSEYAVQAVQAHGAARGAVPVSYTHLTLPTTERV